MRKIYRKICSLLHLPTAGRQILDDIKQGKNTKGLILFLTAVILIFSGLYGMAIGSYLGGIQILYVLIKLPFFFLATLILSVVSAFVLDAILGFHLHFKQYLTLVLLVLAATSLTLASLASVLYFFILTSSSHDFIILVNVGLFSITGCFGVYAFFTARRFILPQESQKKRLLALIMWFCLYGFIGLQMAWMLKPWVGLLKSGETTPFLRDDIKGNVYVEIYRAYDRLIKGDYY